MTRQDYLKNKELIEQWSKGAKVQVYDNYVKEWIDTDKINFKSNNKYRLKSKRQWEDFIDVKGYYVSNLCEIKILRNEYIGTNTNRNTFPTKGEAKACLALSQLCQWRDRYNEGWKPDWNDKSYKYCIYPLRNRITSGINLGVHEVLAFKTEKIRDQFLEDFRELIEEAKPLL